MNLEPSHYEAVYILEAYHFILPQIEILVFTLYFYNRFLV